MNAHMIESPLANVRELDQVLFRECFAEPAKWFQDPAVANSGGGLALFLSLAWQTKSPA
jgi:hypothetical protein